MQPLILNDEHYLDNNLTSNKTYVLKPETSYLKFTRTVVPRLDEKVWEIYIKGIVVNLLKM